MPLIFLYNMDFLALANSRYTTKKYDDQSIIPQDKIEALKEILRLTPSSINSQPWRFTIVATPAVKQQFAAASMFNEQKINQASHLVVFSAIHDIALFEQHIQQHLPEGAVNYYNTLIKSKPVEEVRSWLQHQVYISLGFFLAACAGMGIDATPMEGIEPDKYSALLQQPGYLPLFSVALGYHHPTDANHPSVKPKTRVPLSVAVTTL